MPTNPIIQECNNCDALKAAYNRIECTILDLMRNKYSNISFNTSLFFSQTLLNKLIRWKRIINSRLFNPKYPCGAIDTQDLIKLAVTHAYISDNCSLCLECFPPIVPCICATYSISNQAGPSAPITLFTYKDCASGDIVEDSVPSGGTKIFCACEGSVKFTSIYILTVLSTGCSTTTTTTTSTTSTSTTSSTTTTTTTIG